MYTFCTRTPFHDQPSGKVERGGLLIILDKCFYDSFCWRPIWTPFKLIVRRLWPLNRPCFPGFTLPPWCPRWVSPTDSHIQPCPSQGARPPHRHNSQRQPTSIYQTPPSGLSSVIFSSCQWNMLKLFRCTCAQCISSIYDPICEVGRDRHNILMTVLPFYSMTVFAIVGKPIIPI